MTANSTADSLTVSRISTLTAFLIAVPFCKYLWSEYSATPEDALKGIGYLSILIYCAFLGIVVSAFVRLLFALRSAHHGPIRRAGLGLLAIVAGATMVLMIVRHPS